MPGSPPPEETNLGNFNLASFGNLPHPSEFLVDSFFVASPRSADSGDPEDLLAHAGILTAVRGSRVHESGSFCSPTSPPNVGPRVGSVGALTASSFPQGNDPPSADVGLAAVTPSPAATPAIAPAPAPAPAVATRQFRTPTDNINMEAHQRTELE